MAGGSHHKSASHKPPPSSSFTPVPHRKSRWETTTTTTNPPSTSKNTDPTKTLKPASGTNPSPKQPSSTSATATITPSKDPILHPPLGPTFSFPDLGPPPTPTYGFHMLERRTIILADGSVRSYFALPPDYQDFPLRLPRPPHLLPLGPNSDIPGGSRFPPMSPEGLGLGFQTNNNNNNQNKRKFEDEFKYGTNINNSNNPNGMYPVVGADSRGREFLAGTSSPLPSFRRDIGGGDELRARKYMRIGGGGGSDGVGVFNKHLEVEPNELKKAFLHFVKVINENEADRKRYLEDGKQGRLRCVACPRSSKDFSDMHALIMHAYNSYSADLRVDHLGLHKALCVLMGWNYSKPPDNSKAYQFLPADEAGANQDDLIMWPPLVIIHNTITMKGRDGRMEGLGNRAMDTKIRDLGSASGKSKSLYGKDGHLGITLVKYSGDQSGLKEALRLAEHFEKDNHGRKAWERIQPVTLGKDDEKNPNLVKVDRTGEKQRILYGYLATAADLYKVDFDTRKKVMIESQKEYKA